MKFYEGTEANYTNSVHNHIDYLEIKNILKII